MGRQNRIGNTLSAMVGWQGGRDKAQGNRIPHRTEGDLAVLIAPRQSRDCLRGKVLANSPLRCGRSVRRWPRALPHSHFVSSLPRGRVFAPVRFRSCPPPGEGNSRRIALSRGALLALLASCLSPTSSCARNAYSAQTCPSSLPRRNFLLACGVLLADDARHKHARHYRERQVCNYPHRNLTLGN